MKYLGLFVLMTSFILGSMGPALGAAGHVNRHPARCRVSSSDL